MELKELVNSVIIFISQMTLLRWLIFLFGSLTVTLTVLLLCIYLFLLMLVLFYGFLSIENFWYGCLSFHWICTKPKTRYPISSHSMTLFMLIEIVFVIIWEMFRGRTSFNSRLLLLLINFVSGFRLELMYVSFIIISGQASHISMFLSCLCCCHSS